MTVMLPARQGSMSHSIRFENCRMIAQILTSQRQGSSCLPFYLGLDREQFYVAIDCCLSTRMLLNDGYLDACNDEDVRQVLLEQRQEEAGELYALLTDYRLGEHESELWIAQIIVAGCMGGGHLWHDLGLQNRTMLNELLNGNFPALAQMNSQDMKWKKFLYRQLCERGGDYICRAPSCQECQSFKDCFGSEEQPHP